MMHRFRNRTEAGKALASKLAKFAGREDVVVLGLPRGGVPVAYEVASALRLPLDVFVVRKIGVPGHEELAMGAVASGGIRVMNEDVLGMLRIDEDEIEEVARKELDEIVRREKAYRNHRAPVSVDGKTVLLVDDGIATGSTMLAAIEALRRQFVRRIVVAVPVMAASSLPEFQKEADEVVTVTAPEDFVAVGQWYDDFSQTTDREVEALLDKGRRRSAA